MASCKQCMYVYMYVCTFILYVHIENREIQQAPLVGFLVFYLYFFLFFHRVVFQGPFLLFRQHLNFLVSSLGEMHQP